MKRTIEVDDTKIGVDEPLFIIAECGVTCNYDLDITKELIDVVSDSQADAIKFIFWFPEEIMSEKSLEYSYETKNGSKSKNMYEMLSDLQFTLEEWKEIRSYADAKNVILFSTVNSPSGIEYVEELDLDAYKLSSWDYNYLPLWRKIARLGKPMLIDTGPVYSSDVAKVMEVLREEGNQESVLLHCFHTDQPEQMNMRAIPYMREAFNTLVGYSSPDFKDDNDVMAVTMGASVLEKRLTMDRELPGHHHAISKTPDEFNQYVDRMRNVNAALGEKNLVPSHADLEARYKWFRHLVADDDLSAGTELTDEMIACKRMDGRDPDECLSPEHKHFFVGRELKRDLQYNQALSWEDV